MLLHKFFIILISILLFTGYSFAETEVNFIWVANEDCAEGYKIVMDTGTNVVVTIEGREATSASYVILDDHQKHTFSIFAYGEHCGASGDPAKMEESKLGNMLSWCWKPSPVVVRAIKTEE